VNIEGTESSGYVPLDLLPTVYHNHVKVVGTWPGEVWIPRQCTTNLSSGVLTR
jgi:hypothetical protein